MSERQRCQLPIHVADRWSAAFQILSTSLRTRFKLSRRALYIGWFLHLAPSETRSNVCDWEDSIVFDIDIICCAQSSTMRSSHSEPYADPISAIIGGWFAIPVSVLRPLHIRQYFVGIRAAEVFSIGPHHGWSRTIGRWHPLHSTRYYHQANLLSDCSGWSCRCLQVYADL